MEHSIEWDTSDTQIRRQMHEFVHQVEPSPAPRLPSAASFRAERYRKTDHHQLLMRRLGERFREQLPKTSSIRMERTPTPFILS